MSSEADSGGDGAPWAVARARIAISALFFLFGVNVGMWAAHIPVVQARLDINPATLGLALLASAIGLLLGQPTLGMLMARTGSRTPTMMFPTLAIAVMPAMILSPSVAFLFAALFATGVLWGGMNVSMNTQASVIETLRGRPTMSTFHAGASLGMLTGAVIGGFVIGAGWGNGEGAVAVAAVGIAAALSTIPYLVRDKPRARGPAFVLPNRAVIGLGFLAFLMFIVEGGMVDWSALFLAVDKGASPGWAAAGFALFTGAMALFRVVGNQIVIQLGRRRTVAIGGLLTVLGILVAVAAPWPLVSALGFALVGVGAANIVPILISTAAQTPGMAPSVAVGAVSTMMTLGFLIGPPFIGFVSNAFGLSVGVSLMGLVGIAVAASALLRTWPDAPGA